MSAHRYVVDGRVVIQHSLRWNALQREMGSVLAALRDHVSGCRTCQGSRDNSPCDEGSVYATDIREIQDEINELGESE